MKKVLTLLVITLIALSAGELSAQSFKFGHINTQELFQAMPQKDSAEKKLQAYAKDLEEMLQEMQVEFNKKLDDYQKKEATFSDAVKSVKQKELTDMSQRIQTQRNNLMQEYEQEEQKLINPIMTLIRETITKVAKANNFTYIFDISGGNILYHSPTQSVDVMPMVKTELKMK